MFDAKVIDRASRKLSDDLRLKRNETLYFIIPFSIVLSIVIFIVIFLVSVLSKDISFSNAFEYAGVAALCGLFNGLFWTYVNEGRAYRHRKKILKNGEKYLKEIERLIENNLPFILYLYDFNSGTDCITFKGPPVGGTTGEYNIDGNHRREIISRRLHKFVPIVFLYNSREMNYKYEGYALIVEDENWLESFKALYKYAKYVIIDYKDTFKNSSNIDIELKYIIEQKNNKIIFSGTTEEFKLLKKLYPKIDERVVGFFKMIDKPSWNEGIYGKDVYARYFTIDESDLLFDSIKAQKL